MMNMEVLGVADEIAEVFDKPESFTDFFDTVVLEVCSRIKCELASLLVVSRRSETLLKSKAYSRCGKSSGKQPGIRIDIDDRLPRYLSVDTDSFFVYNEGDELKDALHKEIIEQHADLFEGQGIINAIGVFLVVNRQLFGVLLAFNKRTDNDLQCFSGVDKDLFLLIGRQAQYGYRNLRRATEIKKVNEIGIELSSSRNTSDLLQRIGNAVFESFSADIVTVHHYSDVEKNLVGIPVVVGRLRSEEEKRSVYRKNEIALSIINQNVNRFETDAKSFTSRILDTVPHDPSHVRFVDREGVVSTAALLLKTKEEIVGVMFVSYRRRKIFTKDEQKLMEIFASYAAVALRSRFEMGKAKVAEKLRFSLGKITEIRNLLPDYSDSDIEISASKILLDSILGLLDADAGLYGHIDQDKKYFVVKAASASYANLIEGKWEIDQGLTGKAVRTRQIQILQDVHRQESEFIHAHDMIASEINETSIYEEKSSISIPFILDNEVKGVFHVDSISTASFTEEDRFIIKAFIDQAERAIQNEKSKNHAARRLEELRRLDHLISTSWDLDGVMKFIVDSATELTQKDGAISVLAFLQVEDDREVLVPYTYSGFEPRKPIPDLDLHSSKSISCLVGQTSKVINVTCKDKLWEEAYLPVVKGMQSCLCVPLKLRGKPIGVINVESPDADGFDREDVEFLMTLAGQSVIMFQMRTFLDNVHKLQLAKLTNSRSDFAEILLDAACDLVNGNAAVLWWFDRDSADFSFGAHYGEVDNIWTDQKFGLIDSFTGHALLEDSVELVNLREDLPPLFSSSRKRFDALLKHGYKALISIPLCGEPDDDPDSHYLGVINIYLKEEVDEIKWGSSWEKSLLELNASMSTIVLKNYQAYSKLQDAYTQISQSVDKKTFDNLKQMLRLITHRLNNSVGSIRVDAMDLLESAVDHPKMAIKFNDIKDAANEALSIPEELSEFVQRLNTKKYTISLSKLIDDVTSDGYRNNISFSIDALNQLPSVQANYGLIREVFKEIVVNAIRAMPNGGVISITGEMINNDQVRIDVADEGIGIAEEDIDAIFQNGISMWPDRQSTGGGLFLIKTVVELDHNGKVNVSSQKDKGSVFTIILPIKSS